MEQVQENGKKDLTILHFNDCYSISERSGDICGGCPRFVSLLQSFKQPKLTLFSGDLWSPSKHTSIFKGEQLVEPINACEIDCACIGNHDFDLGLERLQFLNGKCNFPWMLTNLTNVNGTRFASSLEYHVVEKNGLTIGLLGLIEYDWIVTLCCLDVEDIIFEDFVASAQRLAKLLREEYSCDMVIALTHMRLPNDRRLAKLCQNVDMVLGGHDHLFAVEKHKEVLVVKSGTDFMSISEIKIEPWDGVEFEQNNLQLNDDNIKSNFEYKYLLKKQWKVRLFKRDVTKDIEPHPRMLEHQKYYDSKMQQKMKVPLFYCNTLPLETKFTMVRTQEVAIGNFMTDLLRKDICSDVAIYNSGSIRSDHTYMGRLYTIGDLETIHPYQEKVYLVEINAEQLLGALENSVSKLPSLEGRFCQVSHITFEYDLSKPANSRIDISSLIINGDSYEPTKLYRVAITDYMWHGRDGYESLKGVKMLQPSENVRTTSEILFDFFTMFNNREYVDEFRIYQLYEDELTVNFIRSKILNKVLMGSRMAEKAKAWEHQDDKKIEEAGDSPAQRPSSTITSKNDAFEPSKYKESSDMEELVLGQRSLSRSTENESVPVIKVLTRFNVDLILKRKAVLALDCLVRLRKYQLICNIEKGPSKEILPVIKPEVEGRINNKTPQ